MKSIITVVILFLQQHHLLKVPFRKSSRQENLLQENIYIDGTYDGATTNENGQFSFSTTTTGNQVLIASFLVYETIKQQLMLLILKQTIVLRESSTTLDAVVISAGTMETGKSKSSIKNMDIVTTAGSAGNILCATNFTEHKV
jgi:hypothetical protein